MTNFAQRMKGAVLCALFVLVVALTALVGSTIMLVRTADRTVAALPSQIDRQADETRRVALLAISETRKDALAEIASIRHDVMEQVGGLSLSAERQLTGIRSDVFAEINDTRGMLDRRMVEVVSHVAQKVDPILDNVAGITGHTNSMVAHVDDALPPFTDCAYTDEAGNPIGGNPDCFFNRFQGVSKSVEQMARAAAKAAPELSQAAVGVAKSVDGIADDAHTFTSDFVKPKTTLQKIGSWLKTLGLIGASLL